MRLYTETERQDWWKSWKTHNVQEKTTSRLPVGNKPNTLGRKGRREGRKERAWDS